MTMNNETNTTETPSVTLDNLTAEQQALHGTPPGHCPASTGNPGIAAPTEAQRALYANLPQDIRDRNQWCTAGPDKAPLDAVTGRNISVTTPGIGCDFPTACRAAADRGQHIGYVLTADDGFTCIDLDIKDAANEPDPQKWTTEKQYERFNKILLHLDSYSEKSCSGKGVHILVRSDIGKGKRRDGVEVYSQQRFIICTGDVFIKKPIEPRHQLIKILVAELTKGSQLEVELEEIEDGDADQDWYVAQKAYEDKGELGKLFNGDWEGNYQSQSEADLELVKHLARRTKSNKICWSAFRMSALGRRDKALRHDYMLSTLTLARTHLANDAIQAAHGKEISDNLFWKLETSTSAVFGSLTAKPLAIFLSEHEDIEFIIEDIYRRGWLYTMTGSTGAGKTGIAATLALCVGSGTPVGDHATTQGQVLYIAGENPDDVRGRFRATLKCHQWGSDVINRIHVIDQSFLLVERIGELETIIDELGIVMVIVDTDQAVSLNGEGNENGNNERMSHAKNLRRMTRRPSQPIVLDLCHPNASANKDGLVPRGGSSFLNEIDGNTRCHRDESIVTLSSDPNKHRGSAFEISFRKQDVTIDEIKDTNGRLIEMPVFLPATDETVAFAHMGVMGDQEQLLKVIALYPHMEQTGWLQQLDWRTPKGELNKSKISKMLKRMREADPPLIGAQNGLTAAGRKRTNQWK